MKKKNSRVDFFLFFFVAKKNKGYSESSRLRIASNSRSPQNNHQKEKSMNNQKQPMTNTNHYETDSFAYTYYSQIRICLPDIRKNIHFRKKNKGRDLSNPPLKWRIVWDGGAYGPGYTFLRCPLWPSRHGYAGLPCLHEFIYKGLEGNKQGYFATTLSL